MITTFIPTWSGIVGACVIELLHDRMINLVDNEVRWMEHWYLACHKKGKHNAFKAQMFLSKMGIDVFIPQILLRQPRTDRQGKFRNKIEVLFPGYLFVYFDHEAHSVAKVVSSPGMSHFVRFLGIIRPLNDMMIDELMRLTLTIGPDGYCMKNKIHNKNIKNCNSTHNCQRERIKSITEEADGESRSAMFYAFLEAIE